MDIFEHLVHLTREGAAPSETLSSAARAIAAELRADSCRVFLRGGAGPLRLRASSGDALDEAGTAALAARAVADTVLATTEGASGSRLAAPLIARVGCLGAVVVARLGESRPFHDDDGEKLSAIASQLVDLVQGTQLVEVIQGGGDDSAEFEDEALGERTFDGTAASPGIAIGVASLRHAFPRSLVRHRRGGGGQVERERLRDALQKTENDLLRMQAAAASELGEEQALVFGAHLLILHDSTLLARIEEGVRRGCSASVAVDDAFEDIGQRLRSVRDPYIQERIEDVEDLRGRILGHLLAVETELALPTQLVVSPRTSPSVIMELKAQGALGLASELGSTTSHGVLLARALGVPAVTGVLELMRQVNNGDGLIIDGDRGRVIVRPTPETISDYQRRSAEKEQARSEFTRYRDQPARTADGVRFELQANIALGVDLDVAGQNGADGVGLYRTEFAFIARDGIPSREEQVRIYAKAYRAFPDGPISFRILDLAGDKFPTSTGLGVARNAFHGYRSIRVLFDYPHILRTQAQAFALAAGGRPLRILVPMVSSLEELRRIKELVLSAIAQLPRKGALNPPSFGVMIEVPAAVEIADELADEVDFFSIGTNDLIQYALVVDREDARLMSPRDAFHPAILRMIRRVVSAAHAKGRMVSVCGEAAARPEFAIALLALGVDALSVSPRTIPELKQRLAGVSLEPLVASIDALLASSTTSDIERGLRRALSAPFEVPPEA